MKILKISPGVVRARAMNKTIPSFKMIDSHWARYRFRESDILKLARDVEAGLVEGWDTVTAQRKKRKTEWPFGIFEGDAKYSSD